MELHVLVVNRRPQLSNMEGGPETWINLFVVSQEYIVMGTLSLNLNEGCGFIPPEPILARTLQKSGESKDKKKDSITSFLLPKQSYSAFIKIWGFKDLKLFSSVTMKDTHREKYTSIHTHNAHACPHIHPHACTQETHVHICTHTQTHTNIHMFPIMIHSLWSK